MLPMQSFSDKDLKFKHPFGMIIAGPSSSGKSTLLLKFIAEAAELIHPPPASILYCFGELSDTVPFLQRSGINIYSGVPPADLIKKMTKPLLLILDDLLLTISEQQLSEYYLKDSHHQNFSIIFVTQALFDKRLRIPRQNAQYLVLMRSPNSELSIRNIGVQLFPRRLTYFLDSYRLATNKPYGYLIIDLHAASDSLLRLRSGIFKDDKEQGESFIFIPKNGLS